MSVFFKFNKKIVKVIDENDRYIRNEIINYQIFVFFSRINLTFQNVEITLL